MMKSLACGFAYAVSTLIALSGCSSIAPSLATLQKADPAPQGYVWEPAGSGLYRTVPFAAESATTQADRANAYQALVELARKAMAHRTALQELEAKARASDDDAMYLLGALYALPQSKSQTFVSSPFTAVSWYRRSAQRGNVRAEVALMQADESGLGTPIDYVEAVALLHRLASQGDEGNLDAERLLAGLYEHGDLLVPRSPSVAHTWWRAAALHGDILAAYGLARLYQQGGDGVQPDQAKAAFWLSIVMKEARDRPRRSSSRPAQKIGVPPPVNDTAS